jgi:hypothetical protein
MDVPVDSSSHPQYLDKEYDTKESFLAACIKHNVSVAKECKTCLSNSKRAKVTCSDDSCDVRMTDDTFPSHFVPFLIPTSHDSTMCGVGSRRSWGNGK